MAEETKNNSNATDNQQDGQQTDVQQQDEQQTDSKTKDAPTIEELMSQLAQANAEKKKYKNANDKLSKSEAEMKRKLRATQTAEEQKKEEEEEAKRIAEEEKETMRKELNHIKAVAAYKNIPEENTVELLIEAVSEADHSAIATIIEGEKQKAVKEAKAEWQKSRPLPNAGAGDKQITKEQFDKMSIAEKSKLYRENKAEYDRLNSKEE